MSRLAKKPIILPDGLDISVSESNVCIKFEHREFTQALPNNITAEINDKELFINCQDKTKEAKSLLGTVHSIIKSTISGSVTPFVTSLEIIGVGYKVESIDNNILLFSLGYSHDIFMPIPIDITVKCEKPTLIHVSSKNIESLGHFVAKIQSLRKKDPYKGKGIYKTTEYKRRKKGKNK